MGKKNNHAANWHNYDMVNSPPKPHLDRSDHKDSPRGYDAGWGGGDLNTAAKPLLEKPSLTPIINVLA